jgi:hypothetical protein
MPMIAWQHHIFPGVIKGMLAAQKFSSPPMKNQLFR